VPALVPVQQDMSEGLNFDEIYGKYLKVTDNSGDPGKPGFSLVTPLNGESWNWRERPEFKDLVKQKLNDPGFLGDHKYQQIIASMSGKQFDPTKHIAKENFAERQGVAEGNRFDEPLTGYHIVYKNSGNPVLNTPSFETKDQAQKYLMTKMFANHQDFKVVHTANVGVAEGAVEDLAKDLKNPHSYNAIDHMMQTIANKSNVTPKELHDQFVEKYGMTPDEWIKNEQGVEETYGAKLHTEYKRNRFKQLDKIKQQQEKALGLGEAGCNMTNEGRYCSEHGMMECPGYSMTETSVQDKLHQQHQELRKKRGLPDPSYYKKLAAQKQAEIDALRAEIAADQAKSMKESLRPGERHHYEDDPKTGKRVYKGIRGDQYDAPKKKTTGHEPDADRDRAAHRAHDRSMTESIESYMEELERAGYGLQEEKVRLDPKCWKGKKIGSPKTKVKGGVRVNNCVPK
jgi:AraC-like DNA-binding protein